jgi:hypothetical protein
MTGEASASASLRTDDWMMDEEIALGSSHHVESTDGLPEKKMVNWEVLPHPPYSPGIAPSDYHLFRAMDNFMQN